MYLRIFVLSVLVTCAMSRLGGWETADPKGVDVLQSVIFALQEKFPNLKLADFATSKFKIISAKKQVVAGLLYDVIVDFTPPGQTCEVNHFQIGDRFGKLSLIVNEVLDNACSV